MKMWECGKCKVLCHANEEICWQCGAAKGSAEKTARPEEPPASIQPEEKDGSSVGEGVAAQNIFEEDAENVVVGTDELFEEAKRIVLTTRQAATSYLQRRLNVGYSRAARLVDQLEAAGVIGPQDGAKPRKILIPRSGEEDSFSDAGSEEIVADAIDALVELGNEEEEAKRAVKKIKGKGKMTTEDIIQEALKYL